MRLRELAFSVQELPVLEDVGALLVAGELRVLIVARADEWKDAGDGWRTVGTLHLAPDAAGALRGCIDRFAPQLWPGVAIYWAGVRVESVPPWPGIDKILAMAKRLKLLPS